MSVHIFSKILVDIYKSFTGTPCTEFATKNKTYHINKIIFRLPGDDGQESKLSKTEEQKE